jgi:hypothetical protein
VSRGSSTREQENPEVREEVGIANQSGPIGFFLESTTSSSSYPSPIVRARPQHLEETPEPHRVTSIPEYQNIITATTPAIVAMDHREEYLSGYSSPTAIPGKLLRHPRNLVTVEHFLSPILFATGVHFPSVLLHNQGYPKVCPDPLIFLILANPFAGISSLSSCSLFSLTRYLIASI